MSQLLNISITAIEASKNWTIALYVYTSYTFCVRPIFDLTRTIRIWWSTFYTTTIGSYLWLTLSERLLHQTGFQLVIDILFLIHGNLILSTMFGRINVSVEIHTFPICKSLSYSLIQVPGFKYQEVSWHKEVDIFSLISKISLIIGELGEIQNITVNSDFVFSSFAWLCMCIE